MSALRASIELSYGVRKVASQLIESEIERRARVANFESQSTNPSGATLGEKKKDIVESRGLLNT